METPTQIFTPITQAEPLAPHPVLSSSYDSLEEKQQYVNGIFSDTAADYDRVESWISFGTGQKYRMHALKRAGLKPGMSVIDIGIGTGLVAAGRTNDHRARRRTHRCRPQS